MLNLDFSDEQEMLRSTVRDLLADHCPLSEVRRLEDDPLGYSPQLWEQMGKLDLIGLMLPEAYGGSGMSLVEGVVLYEELGRAIAPTPHFVSAVVSGGLLSRAGTERQRAEWLGRIASGNAVVTPAWLEPDRSFRPRGITTTAQRSSGGWVLEGVKRHVAFASAAQALLVPARTGPGAEDVAFFMVDPAACRLTQQFSVASDTQYRVELPSVEVSADSLVEGATWPVWESVLSEAAVLLGAFAVGGCSYAMEITVAYAKDRHQFGKPLGAFQAIAHYLADAQTTLDGAAQLVHEAAWAYSVGRPEAQKLAAMAKLFACRTFRDVTAVAQQIFGGIGFTVDFDIQLYFRRAKALQISWWNDRYLEEKIASAVLDS
jgi:alkylation response protein AidB-like acyl-CoA dehydrogenase